MEGPVQEKFQIFEEEKNSPELLFSKNYCYNWDIEIINVLW